MSTLIAVVMVATVFAIPMAPMVYGDIQNEEFVQEESTADTGDTTDTTQSDISTASVSLNSYEYIYTGKSIVPEPKVQYDGNDLKINTDYSVSYMNNTNVGEASVIISGKGDFSGEQKINFRIVPADISDAQVSFAYSNYDYTGYARKPKAAVKYNGITLAVNTDYRIEYKNNQYPGTATAVITGINNFTSSKTKTFSIAKVSDFKVKSAGTTSIQFSWSKEPKVTGYKIYRYDFSKKKWFLLKTVSDNSTTTFTNKNLGSGLGYKYKIRSYVKKGDKTYYNSPASNVLAAATRPNKGTLSKLTTNVRLEIKASWKKRTSTGYQVMISRSSKFSDNTKYVIKSSSSLHKTFTNLKDNTTYYVKVRAYKTYGGKTLYGAWSDYKKIKTDGTGWGTFNGKKYYYRNGKALKGSQTISGSKYYFSTDTGELLGATYTMWNKVKDQSSGTKWLIATSRDLNRTCVYYCQNGRWVLKYYWKCATGAEETRTPAGIFTVPDTKTHLKSFGDGASYTCWYATRFYKRCYYHSVLYYPNSQVNILDGRLGSNLSHGCVRLAKNNALWIYNNIDSGTRVVVY